MKRVGLYFGSFNPVHVGHLMLAQYMLNTQQLDEVRLVVSPQNPFKVQEGLAAASHRVAMTRLAVADSVGITVSDIELSLPTPSYTVRTLEALREAEPDTEFAIIMGADNVAGLPRWREADKLCQYSIMVYPRDGYDAQPLEGWKMTIVDAPRVEISSTMIRRWIAEGKEVRHFVMPAVAQYIRENNVY